ncbi:MAG: ATP-binding domain-containing protein [Arhodomonas sp.]|nr:ATP-binding domain-containing protein [Arhodomonas sp.]
MTGQRLAGYHAPNRPDAPGRITWSHCSRSRRFRDEGDGAHRRRPAWPRPINATATPTRALALAAGSRRRSGAPPRLAVEPWTPAEPGAGRLAEALPRCRAGTEATDDPREALRPGPAGRGSPSCRRPCRHGPASSATLSRRIDRHRCVRQARSRPAGPRALVSRPPGDGDPQRLPRLGCYNGDIGLVWETGQGLRAHFPAADGGLRDFAPQRLPAHETVYAMTVHKSQGSEFQRLLLVLPDEPSPVLTRELLYTGLTRAREHATLWGRPGVIRETVQDRPTRRASGLASAVAELGR